MPALVGGGQLLDHLDQDGPLKFVFIDSSSGMGRCLGPAGFLDVLAARVSAPRNGGVPMQYPMAALAGWGQLWDHLDQDGPLEFAFIDSSSGIGRCLMPAGFLDVLAARASAPRNGGVPMHNTRCLRLLEGGSFWTTWIRMAPLNSYSSTRAQV